MPLVAQNGGGQPPKRSNSGEMDSASANARRPAAPECRTERLLYREEREQVQHTPAQLVVR